MREGYRTQDGEALLRARISRFFAPSSENHRILGEVLSTIKNSHWKAVVFGGVPRDLLILGPSDKPRDVDLVVDDISVDEIEAAFSSKIVRRTRFGGLTLKLEGWLIDIWPLQETWAFREHILPVHGFADLPKTTFLNVEAVATDLFVNNERKRRIYSSGFFEAVRDQILEINLEQNPFPKLCVVRSLIMAARLRFAIGPRLASYIKSHSNTLSLADLSSVQLSHYGFVRSQGETLSKWIGQIVSHVEQGTAKPFRLKVAGGEQIEVWHDGSYPL